MYCERAHEGRTRQSQGGMSSFMDIMSAQTPGWGWKAVLPASWRPGIDPLADSLFTCQLHKGFLSRHETHTCKLEKCPHRYVHQCIAKHTNTHDFSGFKQLQPLCAALNCGGMEFAFERHTPPSSWSAPQWKKTSDTLLKEGSETAKQKPQNISFNPSGMFSTASGVCTCSENKKSASKL